jgi:cytochrome c oxidase cbb3-type subunit 3/ubiquinol-cytochrome c reductase cytochrome c subunit
MTRSLLAGAVCLLIAGCKDIPGKPKPGEGSEELRPEQVHDFAKLYKENCAACHGENGQHAASISLANPVYLAFAGEANIEKAITAGIPGTLMPGFSKAAGGMLTDEQIAIIAHGMVTGWGKPIDLNGQAIPPYAGTGKGDPNAGLKAFGTYCASCHGADGTGVGPRPASLVDPAYLALVNDQFLRSNIVAGRPGGMPDWRSHMVSGSLHVMSPQEIEDIVAWLGSHRIATPGQPYQRPQ